MLVALKEYLLIEEIQLMKLLAFNMSCQLSFSIATATSKAFTAAAEEMHCVQSRRQTPSSGHFRDIVNIDSQGATKYRECDKCHSDFNSAHVSLLAAP